MGENTNMDTGSMDQLRRPSGRVFLSSQVDGLIELLVEAWMFLYSIPRTAMNETRLGDAVEDALLGMTAEIMPSSLKSSESGVDSQKTNDGGSASNWDGSRRDIPCPSYTEQEQESSDTASTKNPPAGYVWRDDTYVVNPPIPPTYLTPVKSMPQVVWTGTRWEWTPPSPWSNRTRTPDEGNS